MEWQICGLSTFDQAESAGPALEKVETGVGGDSIEPRADHGAPFEPSPALPCPKQCVLDDVLGVIERTHHPIAVQMQLSPIGLGEGREPSLVLVRDTDAHATNVAPS